MFTKALFNFFQRNTFNKQNVHNDWLIIVTELKNFINKQLSEERNLILIL